MTISAGIGGSPLSWTEPQCDLLESGVRCQEICSSSQQHEEELRTSRIDLLYASLHVEFDTLLLHVLVRLASSRQSPHLHDCIADVSA